MKYAVLLSLVMGTIIPSALAVTLDVQAEADVRVTSSYAWRGEVINDEPCFQPSFTVASDALSFQVWGTWDLKHTEQSKERARMDLILDYTYQTGKHVLAPGFVAYVYHDDFQGRAKDTFELFMDYTWDTPLLPSLTVFYDFVDIKGIYAQLATRKSFTIVEDKMNLDWRAYLGWGDKSYVNAKFSLPKYAEETDRTFEPDKSAFLDFTTTLSLPMYFSETVIFTPALKYMHLLDSELRDELDAIDEDVDNIGGSLTLSIHF